MSGLQSKRHAALRGFPLTAEHSPPPQIFRYPLENFARECPENLQQCISIIPRWREIDRGGGDLEVF